MASSGIVQSVTGEVKAIATDGTVRILQVGDRVLANEQIITDGTGTIVIGFSDGTIMDLGRNSIVTLNDDTLNPDGSAKVANQTLEDAQGEVAAIQQALVNEEEFDPSTLEAPAAGNTPAVTGGGENDGFTIEEVDFLNVQATPDSGFETTGINEGDSSTSNEEFILEPDQNEVIASISLDANITADDIISAAESEQTLTITGTVGGDVVAGDIVVLTVNNIDYAGSVVTDNAENLVFNIDVEGSDLAEDADSTIIASVTTSTGNIDGEATAIDTENYIVSITPPIASITLDAITTDNIIDASEAGQVIAITGSVSGDVTIGDTVTLTINNTEYTGQVSDGNGTLVFSINVAGSDLAADADSTIEASVIGTGNVNGEASAIDTASYTVSTTLATGSITLDANITADDIIGAEEAELTSIISITGTVGGDVVVGDIVTLTINNTNYTGSVTSNNQGVLTFSIDVSGRDLAIDDNSTIDASVTTSTGNVNGEATATDTENYVLATTNSNSSITLDGNITSDDIIDATEAGQTIAITGTVGGDIAVGDIVTLTINNTEYTGIVTGPFGNLVFSIEVEGRDLAADSDSTIDARVRTSTGNSDAATTEIYSVAKR